MSLIRHGTNAGYLAHRRADIPVCDDCRTAKREYTRQYRAEKRISKTTPGWEADAACADLPELFAGLTDQAIHAAISICQTCPVITDCANHRIHTEYTVKGPAVGVWAGVYWVADTSKQAARPSRRVA